MDCPECNHDTLINGIVDNGKMLRWCSRCGWNSLVEELDTAVLLQEAIQEIERLQEELETYKLAWKVKTAITDKLLDRVKEQQWVSVEEQLPEPYRLQPDYSIPVLTRSIINEQELITHGVYIYEHDTWSSPGKVTHWLKLPVLSVSWWKNIYEQENQELKPPLETLADIGRILDANITIKRKNNETL